MFESCGHSHVLFWLAILILIIFAIAAVAGEVNAGKMLERYYLNVQAVRKENERLRRRLALRQGDPIDRDNPIWPTHQ